MSVQSSRHRHIPGASLVRRHPIGVLLIGATSAITLIVGATVAISWQGRLDPVYALLVIMLTLGLGPLFTKWGYDALRDRAVREAEQISVSELWLARIEAWETREFPIVEKASTVYNTGHPVDDKIRMGLMTDYEAPTEDIRI